MHATLEAAWSFTRGLLDDTDDGGDFWPPPWISSVAGLLLFSFAELTGPVVASFFCCSRAGVPWPLREKATTTRSRRGIAGLAPRAYFDEIQMNQKPRTLNRVVLKCSNSNNNKQQQTTTTRQWNSHRQTVDVPLTSMLPKSSSCAVLAGVEAPALFVGALAAAVRAGLGSRAGAPSVPVLTSV